MFLTVNWNRNDLQLFIQLQISPKNLFFKHVMGVNYYLSVSCPAEELSWKYKTVRFYVHSAENDSIEQW